MSIALKAFLLPVIDKARTSILGVVALLVACIISTKVVLASEVADRIWVNGTILTMDDDNIRAQAIASKEGKIIAVGKKDSVLQLKGVKTEVIDLNGKTLLPGFVDPHGHVMMGGLQAISANMLAPPDGDVTDIKSLRSILKEWIARNQQKVNETQLIIGFGYDNSTLKEKRHPTRDDLDLVSKDIPILLVHQSGHLFAVNSAALKAINYTASTPNPAGGVIRRKANSDIPDGVLEETAGFAALGKLMSRLGEKSGEVFITEGTKMWARYGYTTAQEARSMPGTVAQMKAVANKGDLNIDVITYPDVLVDRDFIKNNVSATYKNRLRVAGAKLTIDGSPQGFTAWRDQPYYDPVGNYPEGYRGYPATSVDQVYGAIDWAYENNIQIITHANGEAASDLLIAATTLAELKHDRQGSTRPVLIHGQFLREDHVEAFHRLNIFPSLFPMHTFYWGDWHTEHTVGPKLAENISPTGWVRSRGMMFSTHHDAPVALPDSMRVLHATVNRTARGSGKVVGTKQRVDVLTALKAMTIWPAWQIFEEKSKGTLEVGKLADFVILSRDPTETKKQILDKIEVVETIKEGVTVFKN
ncbi:MAG: amidohydrolase [Gammaproteobacteria bacterium]|nr:amidohydrolase [Gammaproteobacteria bacterium]